MSTRLIPIYQVRLERVGSIRYVDREVTNPTAALRLAREIIADEISTCDREHFVAVYLSAKNRPVGYCVVAIGTLTATAVHPREILKAAILVNAHKFIVAHNHPSGFPDPSIEDHQITERLNEAGLLIGIELLDHLVIGHDGQYVSFRERGLCGLWDRGEVVDGKIDAREAEHPGARLLTRLKAKA